MKRLMTVLLAVCALYVSAVEVKVDFSKAIGPVKRVNGVGQPPLVDKLSGYSMFHYLNEAGIPYSRLHDVSGWLGGGLFVDIPNLFPDFDADENDPKNYRFAYTDSLMKALDANGIEPFFRLGVTIENFVGYKDRFPPVNILPPKDFAKWGRICEHVIRHYTEGWADGFKMKIDYWEIWNEPENHPDDNQNPMFRGPFTEYMRLYGTVAPYLKSKFPHLKIGGYGHCGFYAGVGSDHIPAANSSPRMAYFVECSHKFLAAARDNKWPLDFFSYHSYSAPTEAMRQVRFADEHLNEYGFTADKCERIFNEWLPYVKHENLGTALQAAGVAAELIGLQNGPCDVACIYDARCGIGNYSPLFNPLTYKPHKAYYAFTAFNELRKCGTAVAVQTSGDVDLWVAAAKGEKTAAVMMANDSDRLLPITCDFQGRIVAECRITDADRTDAAVQMPTELPPRSFIVVILRNPDSCSLNGAKQTGPVESASIGRMDSRTKDPTRDPGLFGEYWWANRFLSRHQEIEKVKGKTVDVVMLGDSIMHFWEWKCPKSWAKFTAGRTVLNLGYGGDRTQTVIWRINHGELDGYEAKYVVLMIGTNNNTDDGTDPANVAIAIEKIVGMIRAKQPKAKIVLHPIFPRGNSASSTRHAKARVRNDKTNELLKAFAERDGAIIWIDFNAKLVDETGWVPLSLMGDEIHPTDAGYDIWMSALAPVLGQ